MKPTNVMWIMALLAGCATAQNSDLGFLIGVERHSAAITSGRVEASVMAGGQVNYAWQFLERPAGRLYVEMPVMIAGGSTASVSRSITTTQGGAVFFTPGVRYQFPIASRLALYAAAGGGLAAKGQRLVFVSNQVVRTETQWRVAPAFGFGGGVDFRLTRLLSLRGEVRDIVASRRVSFGSRHNTLVQVGFALHF